MLGKNYGAAMGLALLVALWPGAALAKVGNVEASLVASGDAVVPGIPLDVGIRLRMKRGWHLSTRQYARLVDKWVALVGLDPAAYGTHSLRRTKVALLYKKTGNIRACQLLLGHRKLESTVRYLGIEVDDALSMSEQVDL